MLKGLNGSVGTRLCGSYENTDDTSLFQLLDLHELFKIRVPNLGTVLHANYCDWRNETIELGRPLHKFLQESDEHIVNILILENVKCYLIGGIE